MTELLEKPKGPLRTGFTTGACAAAATKGAVLALATGRPPTEARIWLPAGKHVVFALKRCSLEGEGAVASVVKDAGDDPDCTHGAELVSAVRWDPAGGVRIAGGAGVGTITKPGLGLEVGGPAINPVPRRMITDCTLEGLKESGVAPRGVAVTISVPGGEEMAKQTLNARLGIVGGISILGTTGIVKPFSTSAYRASIAQAVDVAVARGCAHLAFTTGGRSEKFAMALLPELPQEAFVQMGDFVGFSLAHAAKKRIGRVTICGMAGKMSKIAAGRMQTHAAGSEVDMLFLARVAGECGAPPRVLDEIRAGNTARHVQEIVQREGVAGFFGRLAEHVAQNGAAHVKRSVAVDCILTDFDGNVLGRGEG